MQSSARNSLKARLNAAIHSPRDRRVGSGGTCPTSAVGLVAVEEREAADTGSLVTFAAAPREVAHRRADAAREDEPGRRRGPGDERQFCPQLAGDVGRLAERGAELLHGLRELLALGFEVAADLLGCALHGHQLLIASVVSLASSIACSGTGGEPFLIEPRPMKASTPARRPRNAVTIRRESHQSRKVASTAAAVANRKPSMKTAKRAAPTTRPMPTPSAVTFFFSSRTASSISSFAIDDAWSATCFAAPPTPLPLLAAWVGMAPPVDRLREDVPD